MIATRAAGDGTKAVELYYGVYDEQGNLISAISKITDAQSIAGGSTEINIKLVYGNTYSMVLWADSKNDVCDLDFTNKKVTYKPSLANQEDYDAFYAFVKPFEVKGAIDTTINLYRPFAQVNIGTNDMEDAKKAGLVVTHTSIKYNSQNVMDLTSGKKEGDASQMVFGYNEVATLKGETFPVANYDYLTMNYLLVDEGKELVTIEIEYKAGADATKTYTKKFEGVPVQRNYRTNIYGSLLTDDTKFTVEIEEDFISDHIYEVK